MSKVTFEAVNSANLKMNNSVDTEKVYDIVANVNMANKVVQNYDSGIVKKNDAQVASFNKWGENNLSINFMTSDVMEMVNIINSVNAFIVECDDVVANGTFVFE